MVGGGVRGVMEYCRFVCTVELDEFRIFYPLKNAEAVAYKRIFGVLDIYMIDNIRWVSLKALPLLISVKLIEPRCWIILQKMKILRLCKGHAADY